VDCRDRDGRAHQAAFDAWQRPPANLCILELGDAVLGCNRESVAAAAIYRRVLTRAPGEFVEQMIDADRDRQVSAALPRGQVTLCRVSLFTQRSLRSLVRA
jgi:hypothetical protein